VDGSLVPFGSPGSGPGPITMSVPPPPPEGSVIVAPPTSMSSNFSWMICPCKEVV